MNFQVYPWQQNQWKQLLDSHASGRLPHALLFSGPDGVGMSHFAICLSAYLLCRNNGSGHACGNCRSCVLYKTANHPDMYHVEPEEPGKQIKVDEIRSLINFIQLSSQYGLNKIAIIEPAEVMNRSAANALLKTLEEPPADVVFLLVTSQLSSLAITIRSRCQRINFSRATQSTALEWLTGTSGLDKDEAVNLLTLTQGRPMDALELSQSGITKNQNEIVADLYKQIQHHSDVIQMAQKWHDFGAVEVFRWLVDFFSRMARIKLGGEDGTDDAPQLNRDLQRISNHLNLAQLVNCYEVALQHYRSVKGPFNLNRTGLLEDFIIYWQSQDILREERR